MAITIIEGRNKQVKRVEYVWKAYFTWLMWDFVFLDQVSDWIDEEATVDTEVTILEGKLKELTDLTATLFARIREHTDRPEALDALNRMINSSEYFLAKARNSSSVADGYFTEVELETLEKKVADIKAWKENAEKDQNQQPMWEMPKLTTRFAQTWVYAGNASFSYIILTYH